MRIYTETSVSVKRTDGDYEILPGILLDKNWALADNVQDKQALVHVPSATCSILVRDTQTAEKFIELLKTTDVDWSEAHVVSNPQLLSEKFEPVADKLREMIKAGDIWMP